jgi:hypothetical protein
MSDIDELRRVRLETVKVRLHQIEMLMNIFSPVVEYFGVGNRGREEMPTPAWVILNDAALNVYYRTVDSTVDPSLERTRNLDIRNLGNPDFSYRRAVEFLTAFHVLSFLQETWLVKFTVEGENDRWGGDFLDKLKDFGDELQKLTDYIHTIVISKTLVLTSSTRASDEYKELRGMWENTAMKFFRLLLFLFDVGITPEAEHQVSRAFSSASTFREGILTEAAFIIHLELCAWKVLTVSWPIGQLCSLAIRPVCAELRDRIVAMRDAYGRHAGVRLANHVNIGKRGEIHHAIKLALDWRRQRWTELLGTLKDKEGEPLKECSICLHNLRDVIYMPCGHIVACRECAIRWKSQNETCPICRTTITSFESVREYLGGDKIIPFGQGAQLPNRDRDGKRGDMTELLAELQKLGLLCSCDGDLHRYRR